MNGCVCTYIDKSGLSALSNEAAVKNENLYKANDAPIWLNEDARKFFLLTDVR
jgi:hypothetical protein